MSHLEFILKTLGIIGVSADPDYPDPVHEDGCLIYHAIQHTPGLPCPHCRGEGIRWGYKNCSVRMSSTFGLPCRLALKKQRFRCRACSKTYLSPSNLTDRGCSISNLVKADLAREAASRSSVTDIARRCRVSWATVQREIDRWAACPARDFSALPRVLSLDEFRAVSTLKGAPLALCVVDGERHEILDICPDRKLSYLKAHFGQYSEEARQKVEYITLDMHEPYLILSKQLFPWAKICVDKFHAVQLASRAGNACRVELMKQVKGKDPLLYKSFKRFWRIPMCSTLRQDMWKTLWVPHLRTWKTREFLLESMLTQSSMLRQTWEIYQSLLAAFEQNSTDRFLALIRIRYQGIHPQMQTCLNTLKKYRHYICHALDSGFSNGPTEACNNHIKVLKRIAYGYRSYDNFRSRILLVYGKSIRFAA